MNEIFARGMAKATRLTLAGKLAEATALIQTALRGRRPTADGSDLSRQAIDIEGTATEVRSARDISTPEPMPESQVDVGISPLNRNRRFDKAVFNRLRKHDVREDTSDAPGAFIAGSFSNAAGHRAYKLYVPQTRSAGLRPLIVMLHGCTQSADDFAAGTRMNVCAEEHGCFVAYPEQTAAANASKCWNWFNVSEQQRGRGEPSIVAGLTLELMKKYPIDPRRVYVAGLSAGGAAAAVLGEGYPDLFAAVGVHSGLACGAARDMPSAFMAMGGHGQSTKHDLAPHTFVPTISFHGDSDRTVHPKNGVEVIARANRAADLQSQTENGRTNDRSFTRVLHRDGTGKPVSEEWVIHGAGHAWSGGCTKGSFTDAKGPDASREMMRFFLQQSLPTSN